MANFRKISNAMKRGKGWFTRLFFDVDFSDAVNEAFRDCARDEQRLPQDQNMIAPVVHKMEAKNECARITCIYDMHATFSNSHVSLSNDNRIIELKLKFKTF